ncbi:hypothetical protein [Kocuria sabuli]|uniref:hypothetical protein n=1 Tax=Kocuria sabuli TaxID=3071448 RepID=UPI0034D5CFCA
MTHPARLAAAGRALAAAGVSLLALLLLVSGPGAAARWPGAAPLEVRAAGGAPVLPRPRTEPRGATMRRFRHAAAYVLGVLAVLATVVLSTPGAGAGAA